MATIVYQTIKKTSVAYAYKSTSYWDKETQKSREKRTCIGRLDPANKQIFPNRPRKKPVVVGEIGKRGPWPIATVGRSFYGATYFLDWIGSVTGVADDVRICFFDTCRQILSIIYYLIFEDRNPLSRFPAGPLLIGTRTGRRFPRSEAANSLRPLLKQNGSAFSSCSGNGGSRRSIWPMTAPRFPDTPKVSGRYGMGTTKTMNHLPRSTWHYFSASSHDFVLLSETGW